MQLRLCEDHAMEAFGTLVQKAYSRLFSHLHTLSGGVEIERLRPLKSNFIQGATKAECNMNGLKNAQCLADNLTHVMILWAWVIK